MVGNINHHFLILALFLHAFDAFVTTASLTLMHLPHDLSLTLAQLICPISYHDPTGLVWGILQQNILDRLPLRDVSWKSSGTISSSQTAVDKLPLRFMPSTASLFKDTDHPFRWFLAPYANIYFVNVDSLEAYKETKLTVKKWVDTMVGMKRASWLIIYAPTIQEQGTQVPDIVSCNKVFAKLSADFYVERAGDKTVNFANITIASKHSDESKATAYVDFFTKVKEGVIVSFFQRCAQYDIDIRRLDSFRGSPQFDFRQLFLVKESLALMYQLMQLPQEALRQYSELEALLSVISPGTLPHNDWPLAIAEDLRPTSRPTAIPANVEAVLPAAVESMTAVNIASESTYATAVEISATMWLDPMVEGENILLYSINSARMRILKNKIGIRELKRYLFARQIHFLAQQHKCRECALKGLLYVRDTYASIVFELPESESLVCTRRWQADLWALNAAVRIVRSCRMYLAIQQEQEQKELKSELAATADATDNTAFEVIEREAGLISRTTLDPITESNMSIKRPAGEKEVQLLRDASLPLGKLLQLAISKLHSISASLVSHPFSRSLGFLAEREAVLEGSGILPLRDLYLARMKSSSFYREEAIHKSNSLHPFQCRAQSKYDSSMRGGIEREGKQASFSRDSHNPLLEVLRKKVTHSEVEIQSVEEALQPDIDRALGSFSTHLRCLLTHGILRKIEVESSSTQCANAVEMDSSTKNSWSLWCSLFVVLLRTIASQDDLIDQGRIANRSVLEYADVLFCHGHHQSAVTSYSRAISGLMEISLDNEIQIEKPWEDVKRATLLKCLYCFVAEGNRVGHIIAAISLRNTQLQSSDFLNKNNIKKIGHSHSSDSRNSLSGHVSPSSNHSPWDDKQRSVFFADRFSTSNTDNLVDNVITSHILPFKLYFEVKDVAVVYDVKNQLVLENSSPQGRIELSAGGTYKLKIQLLSLFPCTVQVDAVSVLYLHQQPAHSAPGSFSNPSSITSSPHHLSPESYSNFNFNFTALCTASESEHSDDEEGNMSLILIPGEMKSICLMITAPADRGNYSANEIRISVKNREESIVFLGEESDHKLSLRKEHATSFIMTSFPSFSVKKKPILSSIEENSVLHGGLVHAADTGVGNNMSGVCAFSTRVHFPLLLPVRDGPVGTGTGMETGVFERALTGSHLSQNIVNREFIIQVEITNNSQSTASITAVQLSNPSGLPTNIALTQDRHKLDEKQMELFLIGNPISPVLPDLIPLGMQPRENSNQISLMSGESYCLAFKFILKEISIGPLDKRVIIGDTTLASIKLDGAVVGSSENVLKSNSGGPDLIFTFDFSGTKGHQSDFEVSLSSSLLYLSEAVEKSQTGSKCKYSLSDKSGSEASSSITAVNASSAESDTGSNYYGQEVVRASQIELEAQGEGRMEEEERRFTVGGIGSHSWGGTKGGHGSSRRVLTMAALIKLDDSAFEFSTPQSCNPR